MFCTFSPYTLTHIFLDLLKTPFFIAVAHVGIPTSSRPVHVFTTVFWAKSVMPDKIPCNGNRLHRQERLRLFEEKQQLLKKETLRCLVSAIKALVFFLFLDCDYDTFNSLPLLTRIHLRRGFSRLTFRSFCCRLDQTFWICLVQVGKFPFLLRSFRKYVPIDSKCYTSCNISTENKKSIFDPYLTRK